MATIRQKRLAQNLVEAIQSICSCCSEEFTFRPMTVSGALRQLCDECRSIQAIQRYRKRKLLELGSKCAICPETRGLQLAHIVPERVFVGIEGLEELVSQYGDNIVALCPSHHFFYDHGLLSPQEARDLWMCIENVLPAILDAVLSLRVEGEQDVECPSKERALKKVKKSQRTVIEWLEIWDKMLNEYERR